MARTDGLADFGYPAVCVFNTHQEPEALYQQLYLMAIEEITGRGVYRSGDLIPIFVGGGSMLLAEVIKEVWIRYRGEYHIIYDSSDGEIWVNGKVLVEEYIKEPYEHEKGLWGVPLSHGSDDPKGVVALYDYNAFYFCTRFAPNFK